jgi:hypothetical protein
VVTAEMTAAMVVAAAAAMATVEMQGQWQQQRRDHKVLRRVSRILIKEGLHFANIFYIFE